MVCFCCGVVGTDLLALTYSNAIVEYQSIKHNPMATMKEHKRLLDEDHYMASVQPQEFMSPDESAMLVEALDTYCEQATNRTKAGRALWVREKLLRARSEGSVITFIGT